METTYKLKQYGMNSLHVRVEAISQCLKSSDVFTEEVIKCFA